jgi:beta-glucanase (GH16 family)
VWADEFNGTGQPDTTKWNYHVGNGFNRGLNAFQGWGNGEWQWYRPENCYQQGGNLVLKGEYRDVPTVINGANWYQFACRITTQGKRSFQYGRIEARLAAPNANGNWTAFWMLGDSSDGTYTTNYAAPMTYYDSLPTNWASIGETDIFEHVNYKTTTNHHNFWDNRVGVFPWTSGQNGDHGVVATVGDVSQFHTYAIEWTASYIRYFVDGVQKHSIDTTPAHLEEFRKPFHVIFNMALGGQLTEGMAPAKEQFPLYMYVDYIRAYQ